MDKEIKKAHDHYIRGSMACDVVVREFFEHAGSGRDQKIALVPACDCILSGNALYYFWYYHWSYRIDLLSWKTIMHSQKLSISIAKSLYDFVNTFQERHHYKSRSAVINDALILLQQYQLEECYRESNAEIDDSFEISAADGLEDETW